MYLFCFSSFHFSLPISPNTKKFTKLLFQNMYCHSMMRKEKDFMECFLYCLFVFFFLKLSLFDCFIYVCMYGYRSDDIKKVNLEHLKCHDTFFLMFSFRSFLHGSSLLLSSLPLSHMQKNVEHVLANAFF